MNKLGNPIFTGAAAPSLGRIFAVQVLILSIAAFNGATAFAEEWVVNRVSGVVYFVAPGVQAFRVKKGMVFEKGYTMGTRAGGRALIVRGKETISVGPNTTFALSKQLSKGRKTTLLQRKGNLTIDVQKRARPHFSVETPFLAAVVKGTRFGVSVSSRQAQVSVERGLVAVEDFASGERVDLGAGQSASSEPGRKAGLSVGGATRPKTRPGKKRAPLFNAQTGPLSGASNNSGKSAGSNSNSGSGNNNAGGKGNGSSSSSNAGGNGNGNSSNSNAGGNGNGNGNSGNSNAGGNGNGNANGKNK
ncbi:FecR domain-containing protein [Labrenzia aggregata]|uniref:FecR domain-containing protein n=2 Tax=Roseibium aggregatum TaxID=187304 RepID=A0A939EBI3_9HYPH|nr:FecR domain-containing protein [Roseibium aggregatum]